MVNTPTTSTADETKVNLITIPYEENSTDWATRAFPACENARREKYGCSEDGCPRCHYDIALRIVVIPRTMFLEPVWNSSKTTWDLPKLDLKPELIASKLKVTNFDRCRVRLRDTGRSDDIDMGDLSLNLLSDELSISTVLLEDSDYALVRMNTTGSVSSLQEPERFLLQTPDDGDLQFSFAGRVDQVFHNNETHILTSSCLLCPDRKVFEDIPKIPAARRGTSLSMMVVPSIILRYHVEFFSSKLRELISIISKIEIDVAEAKLPNPDYNKMILRLHFCNSELVKLERRWRFQSQLANAIREFLRSASERDINSFGRGVDVGEYLARARKEFLKLESDALMQSQLSEAGEYDLSVLPRRISNQFAAVYNLVAQRDTKATIELATTSHRIAEATLRDSSSMKTIAAMTLIFLPATFLCSFFSMTFFDWRVTPEQTVVVSLWVYFAVAIPLTIVVILCWVVWTRTSREKRKRFHAEKEDIKTV